MTDWPDYAIWWHVYPLGFTGAPKVEPAGDQPVVHRLRQVADWLDYAVELGCSGLALGPIFASHSHGYDTIDHFRIDPRLGDEQDFDFLVQQCRSRGLHLLLDGVFNHVAVGFQPFRYAVSQGPTSELADWFHIFWDQPGHNGLPDYECFEGNRDLVTLNHQSPAVADYVAEAMNYWLDRGASGWRLDAAYAIEPEFWSAVLPKVRSNHPQSWFVGEMIHGDYVDYVSRSTLDSVTQYELWKALWSSLNDSNLFELEWALKRHHEFVDHFMPLTFVGNHDVTHIASQLQDPGHLGHALAVLFTVAGSPSIYYGDEQGVRGVKQDRPGGDDAVRGQYPAYPTDLVDPQWPIYHLHQELIALRRRHPWLSRTITDTLFVSNEQLALQCRARDHESDATVVLLLNLAEEVHQFELAVSGTVESSSAEGPRSDPLKVGPNGWRILTY
ncbi:MAG: alpha-amylase family protein [Actinomycetes bacterium]